MGSLDIFRKNKKNSFSKIVSDEVINKIKQVNNLKCINDTLIKRIEKYPKLVDLLLKGPISPEILSLLNEKEVLLTLPCNEEFLDFVEFFEYDEKLNKKFYILQNRVSKEVINKSYQACDVDLQEIDTSVYHDEIDSFIPNLKIDLGSRTLTDITFTLGPWDSFVMYFPKSKYKIVEHEFRSYLTGKLEMNEEIILQTSYDYFCDLDEASINKIANCKIIFSDDFVNINEDENEVNKEMTDYKLIKYNHLIYIIENSPLADELKGKLLYKVKNLYFSRSNFDLEITTKILPYLKELNIEQIQKLTKNFELNITEYAKKTISKPPFNVKYYIEDRFANLDDMSVGNVINEIRYFPDNLKSVVLQEPSIIKKLNISNKEQLTKIYSLLSTDLPPTTLEFVSNLNINVEAFLCNPDNNYKTSFDINPLISKYGVFDSVDEEKFISVADLLGYDNYCAQDYHENHNILSTFERFFIKNADNYHTRSLGLLEYKSGEQLLKGLEQRNHDTKNMKIKQIEDNKYIISYNGLHRFTILRFHYLLDYMKKEKTVPELHELYKIPVNIIAKTNFKRTYCNYLIQKANPDISNISFISADEITIYYKDKKNSKTITEDMLLNLTMHYAELLDNDSLVEVQNFYNQLASFRNFLDTYLPSLADKFVQTSKEVIKL